MNEFRRYLAELYREDDKVRAEHREYMAQRRAAEAPPVSERDNPGVVYREYDRDAQTAVAQAREQEYAGGLCFTSEQFDCVADALDAVIDELRREFEEGIERAQQRILQATVRLALPGELAEREVHDLRARVIRAEEHIERQLKAATSDDKVVDLPTNFWRRTDVA